MTEILCKHCNPPRWVDSKDYPSHLTLHEPDIADQNIETLLKVTERVKWLYQKFPSAQSSDSILRLKYYQYFPSPDGVRLIWDSNMKYLIWNRAFSYEEFIRLENPDTISRAGRKLRREYPEYNGSKKAQILREVKEEAYHGYFAKGGG